MCKFVLTVVWDVSLCVYLDSNRGQILQHDFRGPVWT